MIMGCTSCLFVSAPTCGVKKYWGGVLSNSANLNTSDKKKGHQNVAKSSFLVCGLQSPEKIFWLIGYITLVYPSLPVSSLLFCADYPYLLHSFLFEILCSALLCPSLLFSSLLCTARLFSSPLLSSLLFSSLLFSSILLLSSLLFILLYYSFLYSIFSALLYFSGIYFSLLNSSLL